MFICIDRKNEGKMREKNELKLPEEIYQII